MNIIIFLICVIFLTAGSPANAGDKDSLLTALRNGDSQARMAAVKGLGKIRDEEAVGALMQAVENRGEDWRIRAQAVKELGEVRADRTISLLIKALEDDTFTHDCPALKWNAALALGNFKGYARVVDALIEAMQDRVLYVREAAIRSLGEIGDIGAIPYLITALEDRSFVIRINAVRALGKIGDRSAVPYLKKIAESGDDNLIKNEAVNALKGLQ
jgi:vesicle coat complex subunit